MFAVKLLKAAKVELVGYEKTGGGFYSALGRKPWRWKNETPPMVRFIHTKKWIQKKKVTKKESNNSNNIIFDISEMQS